MLTPETDGPEMRPRLTAEQRRDLVKAVKGRFAGMAGGDQRVVLDAMIVSVAGLSHAPREMDFLNGSGGPCPGPGDSTLELVRRHAADVMGYEPGEIPDDHPLGDLADVDSVAMLELALRLERASGLGKDAGLYQTLWHVEPLTVAGIAAAVTAALAALDDPAPTIVDERYDRRQ